MLRFVHDVDNDDGGVFCLKCPRLKLKETRSNIRDKDPSSPSPSLLFAWRVLRGEGWGGSTLPQSFSPSNLPRSIHNIDVGLSIFPELICRGKGNGGKVLPQYSSPTRALKYLTISSFSLLATETLNTNTTLSSNVGIRDVTVYQNRWYFEKVKKKGRGGGVIFNPKIYIGSF